MKAQMALLGAVVALSLGIPVGAGAAGLHRRPLLARAHRVADTKSWELRFDDYYWLANDRVLFTRQEGTPTHEINTVYRLNVRTRAITALPKLSRLTDGLDAKHSQVRISPDHRWALWADRDSDQVVVSTLNGSTHVRWPRSTYGVVDWEADSRHWVEFVRDFNSDTVSYLLVHDRMVPSAASKFKVHPYPALSRGYPFVSSRNHYLVDDWNAQPGMTRIVHVYDGDVTHPQRRPKRYTIHLPAGAEIADDIQHSPAGDRIAWLLTFGSVFAGGTYNPARAAHGKRAWTGIWVCRLDGSRMHEVGSVSVSPDATWYELPEKLRWLPSGAGLSFIYKDGLYTVAAD